MRQVVLALLGLVLAGTVAAVSLSADHYVAKRYGRLEIAPPAGRWEIIDRESPQADEAGGPVADLQLRQVVEGVRPVVRITGVRKLDATVTAESVLRTSREALVEVGGQVDPVRTVRVAGRNLQSYDGRIAPGGQAARSRLVLVEGPKAFFILQMVVPAAAFDAAAEALDQLLSGLSY